MKIMHKILLAGFVQLFFTAIIAWVSISQMSKIGHEIESIAEHDIPIANAFSLLSEHQLEQALLVEHSLNASLLLAGGYTPPHSLDYYLNKFTQYNRQIDDEIRVLNGLLDNAAKLNTMAGSKQEFQTLQAELSSISSLRVQYNQLAQQIINDINSNKMNIAVSNLSALSDKENAIKIAVLKAVEHIQTFTDSAAQQAKTDEINAINIIIVMSVITIIVSLILPFITAKAVTKPITLMAASLKEMAKHGGDLSQKIKSTGNDETSEAIGAYNGFLEKLRAVVVDINDSADQLCKSSETSIGIIEQTKVDVEDQQEETASVATAVNQMVSTTEEVARNTVDASDFAKTLRQEIEDSMRLSATNREQAERLNSQVVQSSQDVSQVVNEIENISTALDSIQSIAEQTNLLALNAAIESARAGESGRGFAVVADEVRTLAIRTRTSTEDIHRLMTSLQASASNAVGSMDAGLKNAQECLTCSTETTNALNKATSSVQSISDLNHQIATATEEQIAVAAVINQSLTNIVAKAERTASGAVESADAGNNIAQNVVRLNTQLNQFVV